MKSISFREAIYELVRPGRKFTKVGCIYDIVISLVVLLSLTPMMTKGNSRTELIIDTVTAYIILFAFLQDVVSDGCQCHFVFAVAQQRLHTDSTQKNCDNLASLEPFCHFFKDYGVGQRYHDW